MHGIIVLIMIHGMIMVIILALITIIMAIMAIILTLTMYLIGMVIIVIIEIIIDAFNHLKLIEVDMFIDQIKLIDLELYQEIILEQLPEQFM